MNYDEDSLLEAVKSTDGMKRLAAVLSTLSLHEIETFAGEISEDLGKILHNDDKAKAERTQLIVAGIAKYASDPSLKEIDR